MKNIVEEKPTDQIYGRAKFNTEFVSDEDIYNKQILDIGCGFGWFELNALKRGVSKIIGVEFSEKDLETANKHINEKKIDFCVGNAIDLPFKNRKFDCLVSWEVLEHIPKNTEVKMFKEAARVLKEDGVFYMSTPFDSLLSKIFDPAWLLISHRHYSYKKLENLALSNGFVVEKVIVNGRWWEIIGILNLYIAKWVFRRKPFAQQFIANKQNKEYFKEKGFTNIFLKLRKK